MEENEQSGAGPQNDDTSNNNTELNDQQETDSENGPWETIKSGVQCFCGITLNIAVKIAIIFGLVALGSTITAVTVHKSGNKPGRHEHFITSEALLQRVLF